jgi:hypothetical protein
MLDNMKYILLFTSVIFLASCSANLKVERLKEFTPNSVNFVFLERSRWNSKLRISMQKNGFKVLRNTESNLIAENEAKYGIEIVTWQRVGGTNNCINNTQDMMLNTTVQVTEIESNEVVLVIENGGVTVKSCGMVQADKTVFDEIAQSIKSHWKI